MQVVVREMTKNLHIGSVLQGFPNSSRILYNPRNAGVWVRGTVHHEVPEKSYKCKILI